MKKIGIMIPCYNEQENIVQICNAVVKEITEELPQYDYEILIMDNCSTDNTRPLIREICRQNPKIKAILNAKNFGQFNSPYYGMLHVDGDCVIPICADFQDPVEMIPQFVHEWENGYKIVCAIKSSSKENKLMYWARSCYYKMIKKMSSVEQIEHFTGFALYDRDFINVLKILMTRLRLFVELLPSLDLRERISSLNSQSVRQAKLITISILFMMRQCFHLLLILKWGLELQRLPALV